MSISVQTLDLNQIQELKEIQQNEWINEPNYDSLWEILRSKVRVGSDLRKALVYINNYAIGSYVDTNKEIAL